MVLGWSGLQQVDDGGVLLLMWRMGWRLGLGSVELTLKGWVLVGMRQNCLVRGFTDEGLSMSRWMERGIG